MSNAKKKPAKKKYDSERVEGIAALLLSGNPGAHNEGGIETAIKNAKLLCDAIDGEEAE